MDLITELRKMEGINTSFDYGVEIVVMTVKETIGDWEDLKNAVTCKETFFKGLFEYDRVCSKGFQTAKKWLFEYIELHLKYLEFIREFKYCNDIYAMIDEELITLFLEDESEFRKERNIEELEEDITRYGFKTVYTVDDDRVEFKIVGFL